MKICTKCSTVLNTSLFFNDKSSKDGFSYWCKSCTKANVKKHREKPEYRKKQCEWNQKWRNNPDNREKVLAIRIKSQNKIINFLKTAGFVTKEIRQEILERDGNKCLCCGNIEELTIDHIIPISKGGMTNSNNLQTLCRNCNSKKMQQSIDYR